MWNTLKHYSLRYWVSLSFILLAIYFYQPSQSNTHCSPNILLTNIEPKTILGLSEMTLMWVLMAIAHGGNHCYCDIKSLLRKK